MKRRALLCCTASAGAASLGLPRSVPAQARPRITLWFTVEGAKAAQRLGEAFTESTGCRLVVETPDPQDGPTKFQQASAAGKGPDMYVYAHDRIGEWVAAGLIRAITPSRAVWQDIEPLAWRGFSLGGRVWGYPFAIEAITLVYNKALVAQPPASFEEVFALDAQLRPQGKRAILWDYTNAYFTWPLMAAHGGYPFRERPDGSWDARDTGVNSPGALRGAELLQRLVQQGLMPAGSGYPEMEAAMAQGRVAMMINGPWSWVNLKRVGLDFGIAKLPTVGGKPPRPCVGIKGIMINRASRNVELATEFIEQHALSLGGLRAIDQAESIGAPASRAYQAELAANLAADGRLATIMASARDGLPTPSNPEMGRFWSALKSALQNITEGRLSPQQALDVAARRILAP